MRSIRPASLAALFLSAIILSACTARPLYSDGVSTAGVPSNMRAEFSSIAIKPAATRYGQEVRNRLVFLFGGGKGEPANARYSMALYVTAIRESAAMQQVTEGENEPTAATVTLTGTYVLKRNEDGQVIGQGSRRVMSSFDVPRQSYAEMTAEIDALGRAARELAELLQLSVAQDLSKH